MQKLSCVQLALYVCLTVLWVSANSPVRAQAEDAVSRSTFKVLKQADTWLRNGQARQAISQLNALQPPAKGNPFESAVIQQYLAFAYAKVGEYQSAQRTAEAAIKSDLLSSDVVHGLCHLAGQVALQREDFREGALYLQRWLRNEPEANAQSYYLAGYAAYRAKMPQSAIEHLENAIDLRKSPPEEWIRLLIALYIDVKRYSTAEPLVKRMIASSPNRREWWRYLSSLYFQQNHHDMALSSMMLAFYKGDVQKDDVMRLVRVNAEQGFPVKAARLLESELENKRIPRSYDNLKLLFNCWQLARQWDNARQVLAEAAKLAPSGEDYLLLGRLDMRRGNWQAAKDALRQGLQKGGLKRKHQAGLWLGIAAVNAKDDKLAKQTLVPLLSSASVNKEASYWLKRLERSKNPPNTRPQGDSPTS